MIYAINENNSLTPLYPQQNDYDAFYEGEYIQDCNCFVNEQMIAECFGNSDLIRASAILEGAKLDMALSNFLKEGKDYKGLKKDLKQIIKANNMDDSELKTGQKGLMHICKRILQVCYDIGAVFGGISAGANVGTGVGMILAGSGPIGVATITGAIIGFIIGFIINRLMRLLVDTAEFSAIESDCKTIIEDLRDQASRTEDESLKKKLNSEADRLKDALKKYKKNKK